MGKKQRGKLRWPVPGFRRITSGYRTAERPNHAGIDIGRNLAPERAIEGTPVLAVAEGRVQQVVNGHATMGNMVMINHGDGMITRYLHNRQNLVRAGQEVKRGEAIAQVGNTGASTGPHLHFEIIQDGKATDPLGYDYEDI